MLLRFEGRTLDLGGRALLDESGREVPLTRAEFELLAALALSNGRVLSRDQLCTVTSGRGHEPNDRSIDMLVARLRRKIEPDPRAPRLILTIPRAGYKLAPRVQRAERAELPAAGPPPNDARRPAPRGERRQLSILACQIRGLAAVSAGLDPEDEGALMSSVHRVCVEVAQRFCGLVASVLGDSVLISFGYPEAQEDDPDRAVRAGLALVGAIRSLDLPRTLRPHIGIATGLMLVGGSAASADAFGATGRPLSLALHLQSAAPPDTVLIGSRTRELVGGLFECEEMEPLVLGDSLPRFAAWRVTGERTDAGRFDALRRAGMLELVGRRQEMELLRRRWLHAAAGDGQVVLVSGDPGIGKSRLLAEFQEERSAGPHCCLRYFGAPHQTDTSLYPVIGELQREAGFDRADSPEQRIARLAALLEPAGVPALEGAMLLADLLSLPAPGAEALQRLSPEQRKARTLAAVLARIKGLAAHRPVLVLVEDAHWLDPTSLELLGLLAAAIRRLPVMLLVTARPEFQAPWPISADLRLVGLDPDDAGLLIDRLVGGKALPQEAADKILEHADGIPLYIEELTKALLESGALRDGPDRYQLVGPYPSHLVPTTLTTLLASRLDRLGPAKEVAQIGAVIGREFSHALLGAVCTWPESELQAALEALVRSGLVFRRGTGPAAVYSFKHAMVQDAAYGTLLREPLRRLHARIAEALEEQIPDIAERRPELLAHHATAAGLVEKAAGLWGKAGLQSLKRSALLEATAQLNRALGQIATLAGRPDLRRRQIELQVALANALMHTKGYASPATRAAFDQAQAYIDRAEALGEAPDDPLLQFAVIYGFWVTRFVAFSGEALRQLAAKFMALAEKQGATIPLMIAHRLMGTTRQWTGEIAESRAHYDRAMALYDPAEHRALTTQFGQDVGVVVSSYRAWSLWLLGYPEAALADSHRAIVAAREIGQTATLMYALAHASRTYLWTGDYEAARPLVAEILGLADSTGAAAWRAFAMMQNGSLLALAGESTRAAPMIAAGLAAWQSTGSTLWMPCYLSNLARAHAELGHADDARVRIGEAMAAVEASKATWSEAEVHRVAGEIALLAPEPDAAEAEACFRRALAIARTQQARSWELRAATSLARLWGDRGRRRQARELLDPVYGWFREGFETLDLREAKALLDELAPRGAEEARGRSPTLAGLARAGILHQDGLELRNRHAASRNTRAMAMSIAPLNPAVGAEISGVDLARLTDAQFSEIEAAWHRHSALLFRGQRLTDDDLLSFSRRLGELDPPPNQEQGRMSPPGYPDIYVVSNVLDDKGQPIGALGAGEAVWHTDMSYLDLPPDASMLYALEIPPEGGDTWICGMEAAWASLPEDLKARLRGRRIKHDGTYNSGGYLRKGVEPTDDPLKAPGAWHPAVCRHPATGAPALYLGRRRNSYVEGLSPAESEALLDALWAHIERPELAYAHKWRVGDLLLWDNRSTMYRRDPFDAHARRIMHRTQIKGRHRPQAYLA
jgi:alpha-ketoglutarate-dependent taurine dioxygenase/class 3 adenylate cyclase/predicted ATPase